MELPIACSLDAVDLAARRDEWRRLIACHLQDRAVTSSGVRLTFSWTPEVERRLGRLVELERRCCAFARWTLMQRGGEIALAVDADGEASRPSRSRSAADHAAPAALPVRARYGVSRCHTPTTYGHLGHGRYQFYALGSGRTRLRWAGAPRWRSVRVFIRRRRVFEQLAEETA